MYQGGLDWIWQVAKLEKAASTPLYKGMLEWYEALISGALVLVLVFTFVRIIQVDGHSMDPTLPMAS